MFTPFQRLGDTDNTTGVGLGLALSRGLMDALGHELVAEETAWRWPHDGAVDEGLR